MCATTPQCRAALQIQEIGWHARSAEPPNNAIGKKYFPLRSTEITECEGRGVNDYYGV